MKADGRRYPYTAPKQKHSKGKASKSNKTDKSKAHISSAKGSKGNGYSGSEGSVASGPKGMAKMPAGTPVIAPGGRNSRAKGYAR